ncbi:protein STRUBBELIG-RECEPTOR FAMILY 8-like isoform X1 [Zingiber officinale]|uniref:Protein kinase domain-containing protein n=1 Tax=Zingiber officinale TaxID=94328 RepID=A0A8J5LQF4_ZINOF|nr:protein STRUBBELIG-RECEPTOR FAMILY 8-like isoform X1 [Zingiber officinale]XP_042458880.1 protein STRUBBELIG-RECEPTOR FAMILY 8-like isoform X1 [Zingiber officinale]XP_042458881.1 protein STRUBBELIG-RECEPTOR FAMILY 8-like isoform X1 [Zingiber officinale]XP_042458882.1 protein STRUBBELIG-RECEPTOR FAMILY 8-like isoform X1 [Zingiber officinale]KAG6529760.1 hypothetical protein ZIOFF_011974 [Zingiber officinale]
MARGDRLPAALVPFLLLFAAAVESATDSSDVQALGVLYTSLNSPRKLSGWTESGGDPCGGSWKGVSCSGSAVTAIKLSGLGLNGSLGYLLSDLLSLKTLDLSDNNIQKTIPYQLPPNLTYLNLAGNDLHGNLPYSISSMISLNYLNLSHNVLSEIGDLFRDLQNLSVLDLSFNNFSGDVPNSFGFMSNLSCLYLQNNRLTGSVNILANLDLTTLNIANNQFNGWIPQGFNSIPNLETGGNSFSNNLAPPPPPYMPPPPRRPHRVCDDTQEPRYMPSSNSPDHASNKQSLTTGQVIGIAISSTVGVLCILLAGTLYLFNIWKSKHDGIISGSDSGRLADVGTNKVTEKEMQEQMLKSPSTASLNFPDKIIIHKLDEKSGTANRTKVSTAATSYSVASLQVATNSFNQDCLVGEGSLGRVYRAEFPNGKVLAIKKIDSAALSIQEEDNFLEAVSNISRLRHPNIVAFSGYCAEYGQRLLVYEYIGNGTLHDVVHFVDDCSRKLSWNARMKVSLGTARALEYLHEVCLPSVVHRNLKSANVLLDEEFNPYLSDCGLAALTRKTERQASKTVTDNVSLVIRLHKSLTQQVSTEVVGSFGYSAPEFAMTGMYTVKSDVYSFGVVMLELLTGRKPLDSSRVRSEQSLVRWAIPQLHDIDALSRMVDPALNGIYPAKSLSRFADIIALCVQTEPEFRPPMSEVVQQLVQLVQRASPLRRRSGEEFGFSYRALEQETRMAENTPF